MATNDELLAKARFVAGRIIDGLVDPREGAIVIWKECYWQCNPREQSLDPFVYWADECDEATDSDRGIFCRRAIVESARLLLDPMTKVSAEFRDPGPAVANAVQLAEMEIDRRPAPDGQPDPRWQVIIELGEFLEDSPEPIWQFLRRWGMTDDLDLRQALATCLLEHLLEYHFEPYIHRVEVMARGSAAFRELFLLCGKFGQSELLLNAARFDALRRECRALNI